MSGLDVIYSTLMSHEPVDLLIIMLGTNDTKERFNASPACIGIGMERLAIEGGDRRRVARRQAEPAHRCAAAHRRGAQRPRHGGVLPRSVRWAWRKQYRQKVRCARLGVSSTPRAWRSSTRWTICTSAAAGISQLAAALAPQSVRSDLMLGRVFRYQGWTLAGAEYADGHSWR